MGGLFDSHAHLDDRRFDKDRKALIQSFKSQGVDYVLNPGADPASSKRAVAIAEEYDCVFAAVGTHPHDARKLTREHLDLYRRLAESDRVVAFGEIGLDYHYDNSPRDVQRDVFRMQMDLCEELKLPVIIHTREASEDTYNILREYKGRVSGIMHCFSESVEMARKFLDLGYYISICGPVTYKNAKKPKEVAKMVPEDRLLIETDAPYLTPEPHRGQRNDPTYVRHVAEVIGELRAVSLQEITDITRTNAIRAFGLEGRLD